MNIRYGKAFKWPRKVVKEILSRLGYPLVKKIYPLPKVYSIDETLDFLLKERASICRFGDSEFIYIIDKINLPYQRQVPELRERLIEILKYKSNAVLVGLPIGYYGLSNLKISAKKTWRSQIAWIYPRLRRFLNLNKAYYNASMTRLYMDYIDTIHCQAQFEKVMSLWENRTVVLIEGEKSRLGVGNNLFDKAISVKRILGPAHNAFDRYPDLLSTAVKLDKDSIFLIAMGPTAKVLAFDLAMLGFQAIDIGNIDIEYEWYLRGAKSKVKIDGKYTSEAVGGRIVENVNDASYLEQIIAKFY